MPCLIELHKTTFTDPYLRRVHRSGKQPNPINRWPSVKGLPCARYMLGMSMEESSKEDRWGICPHEVQWSG